MKNINMKSSTTKDYIQGRLKSFSSESAVFKSAIYKKMN
jgi:hypothetical protein